MTYAIISDVHANAAALDAVLADARQRGARRIVCLGDVVGYGPEPAKVVERVRNACHATVAGNHDDAVSGRCSAEDFNEFAAEAVARHREELDSSARTWLSSLPYLFAGDGFACVHGEFSAPERFDYVFEAEDAMPSWRVRGEQLLFVGHTHVPQLFVIGASGQPHKLDPQDFVMEDGKRYLVNPGSVGFPRSGTGPCYSTYCIFDSEERSVSFLTVPFDLRGVMPTGKGGRRLPWKRVVGAGALAVAVAAGLAYALAPREKTATKTVVNTNVVTRTETVVKEVVREVEAARYESLCSRTLRLPAGAKSVYCTVRLAKKSGPVQLHVVFKDQDGKMVRDEWKTVKRSAKNHRVAVPPGAAYAVLDAGRGKAGDDCRIDAFDISLEKSK